MFPYSDRPTRTLPPPTDPELVEIYRRFDAVVAAADYRPSNMTAVVAGDLLTIMALVDRLRQATPPDTAPRRDAAPDTQDIPGLLPVLYAKSLMYRVTAADNAATQRFGEKAVVSWVGKRERNHAIGRDILRLTRGVFQAGKLTHTLRIGHRGCIQWYPARANMGWEIASDLAVQRSRPDGTGVE